MGQQIEPQLEPKHSGLGIASFIISILAGILMCVSLSGGAVLLESTAGGIRSNSIVSVILGLFLLALIFACLVAIGLGIGSLFQKNRKKVFGILGIVLSIVIIVGWIVLEIIGLVRQ